MRRSESAIDILTTVSMFPPSSNYRGVDRGAGAAVLGDLRQQDDGGALDAITQGDTRNRFGDPT